MEPMYNETELQDIQKLFNEIVELENVINSEYEHLFKNIRSMKSKLPKEEVHKNKKYKVYHQF
jgi:hypothetical protein